ncbi:phospholipase D, partial [mine drainage metagenome]
LVRHGVDIRLLKRPYLHAKLILTATRAFIGSQNLNRTSLEQNREVGILIRNPVVLKRLRKQFAKDWAHGRALSPNR